MSFKGFADTDINELRKNLKKRSELTADFKEQIDNQQGISNYVKEITIKQAKPIVDAIKKEQDDRAKSTTGARSEADEIRVLTTTPITIMEYFRTLRPDIFKDNTESEISIMDLPMKLMNSEVEIKTDGKRAILVINGKSGNPDQEIPLDLPLTWLLLFNVKTLQNYGLLKNISIQNQNDYLKILEIANDGKKPSTQKIIDLRNMLKQKIQTATTFPLWEDPAIATMSFMDLVEYLTAAYDLQNKQTINDEAIKKLYFGRRKVYDQIFRFDTFDYPKKYKLEISDNKGRKRKGTVDLTDRVNNVDNTINISFPRKSDIGQNIQQQFQINHPYSKISLLLTPILPDIKKILIASTGDDRIYNSIYLEPKNLSDKKAVQDDIEQITDWIYGTNQGDGLVKPKVAKPKAAKPKAAKPKAARSTRSVKYTKDDPELSGYGVLRDPFKDAKDVKKTKGNVVHRSYNIVDGMFGNVEVDVPKLYTRLHLTAKKGGAIIYDKPVDKDTVDLLTTHPRRKRVYSKQSIKTLAKLMELSDQPIKTNSRKLQMVQKYHNKKRASVPMNEEDVSLDRLTTLLLEHQAGNYPNAQLQNEIAHQADTLLRHGLITEKMHKQIYSKYVVG